MRTVTYMLCLAFFTSGCSDRDPSTDDGGPGDAGAEASVSPDGNTLPDGYGPLWPCSTPGRACNAHDPCAINPICGKDMLCHPTTLQNCDDGLDCTQDVCKGLGLCSYVVKQDMCMLAVRVGAAGDGGTGDGGADGGAGTTVLRCFKKGEKHPGDTCRICDPDQDSKKWSGANGGSCDDLDPCTKNDYCQSGICKGTNYSSQCSDSYSCTVDTCDGKGGCLGNTLKSDHCLIGGVCYKDGGKHPSGSCMECDVTQSQSSWTAISDTCTINSKCHKKGDKHPKGCAECDPTVSTTTWTVKVNTHCLINDACITSGTKDAAGCAVCDPTTSKLTYTPLPGLCKIENTCYQKSAVHPKGCGECKPSLDASNWTLTSTTDCLINNECYKPNQVWGCYKCDPTVSQTAWQKISGCNNVAFTATATSSGGGKTTMLPSQMNDLKDQTTCGFHWLSTSSSLGTASGKWIQLSWPAAVTVSSVKFDTSPSAGSGTCSPSAGRNLAGGKLQYWSGTAWVTIGTIAGKLDDWSYSFTQVTTKKLRLYDAHATQTIGQKSNPIIYEWEVHGS